VSDAGPPPMSAMRLPFFVAPAWAAVADVFLEIGGDALQAADRDRLRLDLLGVPAFLDAPAAARGLTGTIARAAENPGKTFDFQLTR
jgi:hypothetical protein